MSMLLRIARKQAVAINIIGCMPYNQCAIYDITEFLYIENKKYVLTNNTRDFKKECNRHHLTNDIILNTMDVAYYDKLAEINEWATDANKKLWNMLVFPTPRDRKHRIYMCNRLFIVEYYLSDKYDDKKNFVKFLTG